ncbi:quinone-interacting membrane-bound oxidoreductase complex subunit QmoC [Gemmatimonadota bacterium]
METAEATAPEDTKTMGNDPPEAHLAKAGNGKPVHIEPDLDFIRAISVQGAESYKKCFQCGTCAATCPLSPESHPFPRKEMAWAAWGMRDRLLRDPDVWLCHQCNDCSTRCPRGGRPGEVLAAIRRESVLHYATPRFLARLMNQQKHIPLRLGIPVVLLGLALLLKDSIGNALGFSAPTGEEIVYSYSPMFPHWLLNTFFGLFGLFALVAIVVGVVRFWRALSTGDAWWGGTAPKKGVGPSIVATLKKIITHDNFTKCRARNSRAVAHFLLLFGFVALTAVTLWVITGRINPLIRTEFVYPFSFWSPWKILANIGGVAVLSGCILMIWERLTDRPNAGYSLFFDWAFLWTLFAVVFTGFVTEAMHYLRMVPHRHVAYFVHLVFVFSLLIYLPYSKFAHVFYRFAAMVFAERIGRESNGAGPSQGTGGV